MPLVTTLIDDKSPLIAYDSSWLPGNSGDDPFEDQYYLGTFTTNNVTNGKASFTFNGTGFWIYGAKRSNHGTYSVEVDGATYTNNSGSSANNQFMVSLFNTSGLTQGSHTVSLTNTGTNSQYVDIDLIVWESEVGNTSDQLITETVQDTDARFQYEESAWNASPSDANFYSDGTGHVTQTYQASATLTFTGETVTLVGSMGPQHGPYSVKLDSGQASTYNATAYIPLYGVTLYYADNLGGGQHQLVITNLPAASGQELGIDYALVSSVVSSGNSSTTTTSPGVTSTITTSSSLSTGAIVGIIAPAVVAVLAAVAAFFYRSKFKSIEKAYNQLYNVHTTQQHTDVPVAFSTSPESNTPASRMRNAAPSASFGHDLQPSNTGSPGLSSFPISSASEADMRGIAVPSDQSRVIVHVSSLC
ncbi:hypothetical protein SCLCIDRAFT_1218490 [Scleroderma citrinum Foug A]|uniref:Transmembrane protein n=1 Tax=Scleroderma citrinum Foug A TaxID=1036808 RepID=A0A0C2Z9H3_9AGAM|nr:hypothetical protein SCLCIDRAFT_1218490 [Scleroderma citrinum Foug A]